MGDLDERAPGSHEAVGRLPKWAVADPSQTVASVPAARTCA